MAVIKPDGKKLWVPVSGYLTPEQQALMDEEQRIEEEGADVHRQMTPAEEDEWEQARKAN